MDDDLRMAAAGIIVLIAVFNVSGYYFANRNVEPFSELGILGPTQKIANYPTSVLTGQNFTLYLYVGNHESHVMYYQVLAKLGSKSSVINENISLSAPPVATYRMILRDNQTYLQPITLSINHNGTNVRLVFELWVYQTSTTSFVYDHRWNQIFLNVTGPSI